MSENMYHISMSKDDNISAECAFTGVVSVRIPLIAKKLDNLKQLVYNKDYLSFPGEISSKRSATQFQESYDTNTVIIIAVNALMKVVERDGKEGRNRERACSVE